MLRGGPARRVLGRRAVLASVPELGHIIIEGALRQQFEYRPARYRHICLVVIVHSIHKAALSNVH